MLRSKSTLSQYIPALNHNLRTGVSTKLKKRSPKVMQQMYAACEPLERRALLAANPVITEFLAANNSGLKDSDGEWNDWIELYNAGDQSINLNGWHLTNDSSSLSKWTFPSTSLAAGARMVVFASEKNTTSPQLHTNFKLSPDSGGYLALVQSDGTTVASSYSGSTYPVQYPNISYGRPSDNISSTPVYFSPATPGTANGTGASSRSAKPTFGSGDGIYSSSFTLTLAGPSGSTIRYTTDGSEPTSSSTAYTSGGISISHSSVVRAVAFESSTIPSPVATSTYIFVDDAINQSSTPPSGYPSSWSGYTADYGMDTNITTVQPYANEIRQNFINAPIISIVTNKDNLFDSTNGIYVNPYEDGPAWERPASMEIINPDGREGVQLDMSLAMTGGINRSEDWRKHPFHLRFSKDYGPGKLEYPIFGDLTNDDFDDIILRSGNRLNFGPPAGYDAKMTSLSDPFMRDTQRDMGWGSAKGTYANVFINGLYWGVYGPSEKPSAQYAARNFGGQEEDWDALNGETQWDNQYDGSLDAWDDLNDLILTQGVSSNTNYQKLQGRNPDGTVNSSYANLLDVTNFADWYVTNLWGGNWDWGHNWWAARHSRINGVTNNADPFRFYNWDGDATIADPNFETDYLAAQDLMSGLLQNADFRMTVADRIYKHLFNSGALSPEKNTERFMKLATQLDNLYLGESARWGDTQYWESGLPYTRDGFFRPYVSSTISTFFQQRNAAVLQRFRTNYSSWGLGNALYVPTTADAPTFSQRGGLVSGSINLTLSGPSGATIYYTLDGSDPRLWGSSSGSVSGLAYTYSGAITINSNTVVTIRAKNGSTWSPIDQATFTTSAPAPAQALRVTEIMYNPASGTNYEFIEVTNISDQTVSLSGVSLADAVTFNFSSGSVSSLTAGQSVVVVNNLSSFQSRYGTSPLVAGTYSGNLDNGGEIITLMGPGSQVIQSFKYDDFNTGDNALNWPPGPDGSDYSLVIDDPTAEVDAWNRPGAWRASTELFGSPGVSDPLLVGQVFNDSNSNGTRDSGETGVSGITVYLYAAGNNLSIDANDTLVGTATTDSNGTYRFNGIGRGYYHLRFIAPGGKIFATKNQGTNDKIDSDAGANGRSDVFAVTDRYGDTTHMAGLCTPTQVTASFDSFTGALVVNGTSSADTITITSISGNVSINGSTTIAGPVAASAVKTITVYTDGANDIINLAGVTTSTFANIQANGIAVYGGDGNDSITGSAYADALYGELGNDTIEGGLGNDTLNGDGNDDTYVFSGSSDLGTDSIIESANADTDTLDFTSFSQAATVNLSTTGNQTIASGKLVLNLSSATGIENVLGSASGDAIVGNELANSLSGNGGNDTIEGGLGDDTLNGGSGDDTYVFSGSSNLGTDTITEAANVDTDTLDFTSFSQAAAVNLSTTSSQTIASGKLVLNLSSATGIENVLGSASGDTIVGNDRANSIASDGGNDTLTGGLGNDTLNGGSGNDTYVFSGSSDLGTDTITEAANVDTDTLDFTSFSQAAAVNLSTTSSQTVASGKLVLTLSSATGIENVLGSASGDAIVGNDRANSLSSGDGNDTLEGGLGNDSLTGGNGDDTYVFSGSSDLGTDTITEAANVDTDTLDFTSFSQAATVNLSTTGNQTIASGKLVLNLSSATGIENVLGSASGDTIVGNDRANSIASDGGNDTLTGGLGNDTLNGGSGNDTYVFSGSSDLGTDTITEAANVDTDTLDFTSFSQAAAVNLSTTSSQTVASGKLVLTLSSATGIENVLGSASGDAIVGNDRANSLSSGDGNDTLEGGLGNDSLTGGNGNDTYVFSGTGNLGTDTIVEAANADTDTLDFSSFGQGAMVNLGALGNQTVSSGKLVLSLSNATGLENINGSAYADTLTGNARNNSILGNGGDDLIIGLGGNDTIDGGSGQDTIYGDDSETDFTQPGDDSLLGGDGNDQIRGDAGASDMYLNGGNDTIAGGLGDDTIFGDGVAGTLEDDGYGTLLVIHDNEYGGGYDVDGSDSIDGDDGNDLIWGDTGYSLDSGGSATAGVDTIHGDAGADTIFGDGDGGATQFEESYGGYGYGGYGNINYEYDAGDSITGDGGDDLIWGDRGGLGDDYDYGGNSYGYGGADTIEAGAGNDESHGEFGNDRYVFSGGTLGTDMVAEPYVNIGSNYSPYDTADTLDFQNFGSSVIVNLGTSGNQTVSSGNLVLNLLNYGGSRIEHVIGSASNDTITGNELANSLSGNGGNDTINGSDGNDTIDGGSGSDSLLGGNGNDLFASTADGSPDTINGGADNDTLNGHDSGDSYSNVENVI